jgi:hypothetical protein
MLKRPFKNPYYSITYEDFLIEEAFNWAAFGGTVSPPAGAPPLAGGPQRQRAIKQTPIYPKDWGNYDDPSKAWFDPKINSKKPYIPLGPIQAKRQAEQDEKDRKEAEKNPNLWNKPRKTYGQSSPLDPSLSRSDKAIGKAGEITDSILDRISSNKGRTALGVLAGAGLVAGGIAAYNHFTNNEVPLTMPTIGGGVVGGAAGALYPELSSAASATGSFLSAHPAIIGGSLGLLGVTALVLHPYITLGIAGSLGSFAYVLNRKENVDQIKTLSTFIDKVYSKAILLRYNELQTIKASNQKAFQEASSKCELGGPAFAKHGLGVNYNCALEAYIGYCTAMFVGLLTVYLQSVNAKYVNLKHISKIEQVLAIQEDTGLNIMLNEVYHKLIKSIAFIFKPFPEVVSKYNIFIDNTILDITQKLDTKVQARPMYQQSVQSGPKPVYNGPKPAYKPNDHRQFKNKYLFKPA